MNFLSPSHSRLQAFSMVELLATVAIVGILASLIVPKVSQMVERGQSAKCLNSLKNISTAIYSYAADNDGKIPAAGSKANGSDNNTGNWFVDIMPYYGKIDIGTVGAAQQEAVYKMINCPVFMKKYKGKPGFITGWVGYGMNTRLNLTVNDGEKTDMLRRLPAAIPNHSKTILVGEGCGLNLDIGPYGYKFSKSNNNLEGWANAGTPDRHGEYSNYLFVDGHIESLKQVDAEAYLRPRNE